MVLTTVNSHAIHALGYDRDAKTLEIIFNSGGIYTYADVPERTFIDFLRANSKGTFFRERIHPKYRKLTRLGLH